MGLFSRRGAEGVPQPSAHDRALKLVSGLIPDIKLDTMGELIGFNVSQADVNGETYLSVTGLMERNEIGLDVGALSAISIEISEALELNDQPFTAEVVATTGHRATMFGEDAAISETTYLIRIIPTIV